MRQIFAVGGKFSVQPWQQPVLQRHLLSLSPRPSPRICLLSGASGDNPTGIELFYRDMGQHDCRPTHLNMHHPVTRDFDDFFGGMDIIYVSGGATKNLVAVWRDWGVDVSLRGAWQNGVILSGTSAGAICWFEDCITDSYPPEMLPLKCIGLLKGSACTHYDARPDRAPTFRRLIADGSIAGPGLATDDDAAAHFIDDELHEAVTAREAASAYLVTKTPDGFAEQKLATRFIG